MEILSQQFGQSWDTLFAETDRFVVSIGRLAWWDDNTYLCICEWADGGAHSRGEAEQLYLSKVCATYALTAVWAGAADAACAVFAVRVHQADEQNAKVYM